MNETLETVVLLSASLGVIAHVLNHYFKYPIKYILGLKM